MTLNKILAFDALTCALMGILLLALAGWLSALLALPQDLLFYAGGLLLPIAAFMAVLSRQATPWAPGVWLVVIGNFAWVAASLAVLPLTSPNLLGTLFVLAQAVVVAALAVAEMLGMRRPVQA